jgi:hypothetical protein
MTKVQSRTVGWTVPIKNRRKITKIEIDGLHFRAKRKDVEWIKQIYLPTFHECIEEERTESQELMMCIEKISLHTMNFVCEKMLKCMECLRRRVQERINVASKR